MSAKIKHFLIFLLFAQFVTGCAWLNDKPLLPLDNTAAIVGSRISYLLSWQEAQENKTMLLVLEHQQQAVQLVGLSNTGITLFILQRDANGDQLEKTYFYSGKPAAKTLLDQLLLAYYEPRFISRELGADWQLQVEEKKRQWFYRDKLKGTALFSEQQGAAMITLENKDAVLQLQVLATENLN